MTQDSYSPEAICRSLGLPGFDDAEFRAEADAVRLLLCPSFHPELCITLTPNRFDVRAPQTALRKSLRDGFAPGLIYAQTTDGPNPSFDKLQQVSWKATEAPPTGSRVDDSMETFVAVTKDGATRLMTRDARDREPWDNVLRLILARTHSAVEATALKNAVADAGKYCGLSLPRIEETPASESAGGDYLEALQPEAEKPRSAANSE